MIPDEIVQENGLLQTKEDLLSRGSDPSHASDCFELL